ncbi:MAG: hypothetical protein IJ088_03135 [Clostridia bacterium]|nr:hypothetical protein [Clostridia bacterium]
MHKAFSFTRLITGITTVLSGCFLLFLAAASLVSTCTIRGDYLETTFFISSSVLPKIFLLCLCTFLLCVPRIRKFLLSEDITHPSHHRMILITVLFILSACWALFTQPTVISDQAEIQLAAEQLNYGDFSCIREGGYLARHHHQLGAILVSALVQRIAGRDNYLVYQLINALLCALSYLCLMRLSSSDGLGLKKPSLLFGAALLFFPFLLYSTFVYATIPAFFLSLLSFERILAYEKSPSLTTAAVAGLSMALAIFLKQNSLIFLIAAVVFSLLRVLRSGVSRLLLPVSLILFSALFMVLPKVLFERVTGHSIPDGISPLCYLTMGVQDSDRAPGWYNSYVNSVYGESGTAPEIQKDTALRDYSERLRYFRAHPQDAVRFFVQKTASQWNNPTFESLWINQVRGSNIRPADWIRRLVRPTGADFLTKILNPIQFLLLFLAFLSLFRMPENALSTTFLLLVTFVGGFLFHSFWEAKCQYTLPYMVLLLPFSVRGLETAAALVASPRNFLHSLSGTGRFLLLFSLILLPVLALWLSHSGFLTCDNAAYAEYLRQVRAAG